MAEEKFDPYHAWLGIPKWDRPANAYRLLGIEVFEENRSVIEAAANRQMAYLQELSSGDENIDEAQKLLGQVSKARVVLLNPDKKAAYDKKLSDQLDSLPGATGDGSQSTKNLTHSSAAVTLPKKEKSFNRLSVIRVMLLGLVGLLVIACVLLFRTKNLVVRTYIDQNNNQRFDAGEEEAGVGIVKYFINKQHPDGGELDRFSWPTDASGIVNLTDIQGGKIGFAAENPYQVSGNQDKPYYEAMIDDGPRFFAQVVDIPVSDIPVSDIPVSEIPVSEIPVSEIPVSEIEPFAEKKQIESVAEKEVGEKRSDSAGKLITVFGQFTTEDRDGQQVGVQVGLTKNETAWLDINGDGVVNQKEVRYYLQTGEDGKFELEPFLPEQDKVPTLSVKKIKGFKPLDPVPIPVEKAKDGKLILEIPPLIRKTITISGTVSTEPATESAEGYLVFMDRNENREPDEGEPRITTNGEGNYDFTLPFFIEDYPKSDQGYSLDLVVVGAPQDAENIEIRKDFNKYEKLNPDNWREGVRGANFIATNNDVKIAIPENGAPGDDNQASDSGSKNLFDPNTESKAFLEHLGFSGDLPEEGSDEKPVWTFQIGDELISQFTTAKRGYDKAAKKQNWGKILELEAARKNNDAKIKDILTNAKTEAAKTRAQQKVAPYNEANTNIDAELSPLKESRDALKGSLVMAAKAVEQQQQQYQAALDDTEGVKTAATALGVSIQPLTKKQRAAWQSAIEFLAERELVRLGLQKQGRKWVPTGVAIEADGFRKIKMYAQQHFQDYVRKKNNLTALISQNQPSMQSQIDKLEKDLDYQTRAPRYKNAKKEFDRMTKIYLEHLDTLQKQRAEIESKKDGIEKTLGGAKKLQAVLKLFPTDKAIEKKRTFITNLQTLVN